MQRVFEAVYEHGVLRPLEPLNLSDRQRVQVTVQETPQKAHSPIEEIGADLAAYFETEEWEAAKADNVSLEEVRQALASIPGSLAEAVIASREDRC
jgi:predicted DNA-binding antitoxin AbrB/MazE fold protein